MMSNFECKLRYSYFLQVAISEKNINKHDLSEIVVVSTKSYRLRKNFKTNETTQLKKFTKK